MAALKQYSWSEIRKHATKKSGWLVIEGKVYDITDYLASHPGGPQPILDWLGKDATQSFKTKGGLGNEHSDFAMNLLKKFLIGQVEKDYK